MDIPLRYLEVGEMVAISGGWVGDQRKVFESIPEIKPLLPQVEAAHNALVQARPSESAKTDPTVEAIIAAQRAVDIRHDHALRALFFAHEALAEHLLAQDPPNIELADAVRRACNRLVPEGLGGTIVSYQAEAGNAEVALRVAETDAEIQNALSLIAVTKKMGGKELLKQWAGLGAHLGELERYKSAAVAGAIVVPRTALLKARNAWISLMSTMLGVLDHAHGPEGAVETIRRSATESAQKAAKRAAAHRKAAAEKAAEKAARAAEGIPSSQGVPSSLGLPSATGMPSNQGLPSSPGTSSGPGTPSTTGFRK